MTGRPDVELNPTAGYRLVLTTAVTGGPGTLGLVAAAVHDTGGELRGINATAGMSTPGAAGFELAIDARDVAHQNELVVAIRAVDGIEVLSSEDRVFAIHQGGKVRVQSALPLRTRDDLSMAYTPGVARVCRAIADDPERAYELTIKNNTVAVLSNGTAVLGLGDIGPAGAMPVMEGKAMLFREFAGIDAFPLCVNAPTADALVDVATAIAPTFGGINLEDVAAPVCFEAEARMKDALDIPVFHDDQHGTAVVTLAALINAARVVGKDIRDLRVAFLGAGAAGVACAKLMLSAGVGDVVGVDRLGILHSSRAEGMTPEKTWFAVEGNESNLQGGIEDALRGADVFVGLSGPNLVKPEWVAEMANDAIVFAMANPVPEIMPELMPDNVAVVATGRSDYPNQINNVLVFPGFFRGLLDVRAHKVTDEMKLAASRALAAMVSDAELDATHIITSPFDPRVVPAVAAAVASSIA
ncbi:MAG: NAD-dependent malic enzyme [Acidimicrobiia bacterium]